MNEPMLVGESSAGCVPQTLVSLYKPAQVTSVHEALFVVLHLLMTESGFELKDCPVNSTIFTSSIYHGFIIIVTCNF